MTAESISHDASPDMLPYALAYLRAGFHVMPIFSIAMMGNAERIIACAKGPQLWRRCLRYFLGCISKTPLGFRYVHHQYGQVTTGGWKALCTNEEDVVRWFTLHPKANIGIATGRFSDLAVLDVDYYCQGEQLLPALSLPPTRCVSTGNGMHYYFLHPGGRYRTRHRIAGILSVLADEYTRVLAPPSLHSNGKRYRWVNPETPLAPLPSTLRAVVDYPMLFAPMMERYKIIRYSIRQFWYGHVCFPALKLCFRLYFAFRDAEAGVILADEKT